MEISTIGGGPVPHFLPFHAAVSSWRSSEIWGQCPATGTTGAFLVGAGASCTAEGLFLLKPKSVPLAFLVKEKRTWKRKGRRTGQEWNEKAGCDAEHP